jgi:putative lipoprotein (rSAM/lipoprotein system)
MRKARFNAIKRMLPIILSILGIGSVSSCWREEYGCPTADFSFQGTVTDESRQPIDGIKVSVARKEHVNEICPDTTDSKGTYHLQYSDIPSFPSDVVIYFEDTDGAANGGAFQKDSTTVTLKESDLLKEKDLTNSWYEGKVSMTIDKTLHK